MKTESDNGRVPFDTRPLSRGADGTRTPRLSLPADEDGIIHLEIYRAKVVLIQRTWSARPLVAELAKLTPPLQSTST
jgi:hypothetical protein